MNGALIFTLLVVNLVTISANSASATIGVGCDGCQESADEICAFKSTKALFTECWVERYKKCCESGSLHRTGTNCYMVDKPLEFTICYDEECYNVEFTVKEQVCY
ncbi:uncharacterized protein [Clytia hemisphaerica]|uniref:Cnidarian restricted protein n=1 Tax=Clytia hemisphaerica TaxID=252671 RepID=A0A7M5XBE2_9CNID